MSDGQITDKVEYKETNLALRHFSGLRFIFVGLFLGINGAVFSGLEKVGGGFPRQSVIVAAASLVTGLTVFFFILEWVLNRYIDAFWAHARTLYDKSYWQERPFDGFRQLVTSTVRALYVFVVAYWWIYVCVTRAE